MNKQSYSWRIIGFVIFAWATLLRAQTVTQPQAVLEGDDLSRSLANRDIGITNNVRGSVTFNQGVYVVKGAGADIWGKADEFQFTYTPWDGDGEIVARVASVLNTDPWAKAGVMIRQGTDAGARYAMVALSATNGISFQHRLRTNSLSAQALRNERISLADGTNAVVTRKPTAPYWIKLVRRGNRFAGYCSADGLSWEWLGTVEVNTPQQMLFGLAVSSHNPAKTSEAVFDNVSITRKTVTESSAQAGTGDGLQGRFYPSIDLSGSPILQINPSIDFDWSSNAPVTGINRERFSARWEGEVQAQFSELYAFHVISDDRARLWINGRLLVDDPSGHEALESSGTVPLEAGQKYLLRLEFFQNGGDAVAQLLWSSPSTPKQIVPQTQLYSGVADSDADGLPNVWERSFRLNGLDGQDANEDPDGDGLTNLEEYRAGTNPLKADRQAAGLPVSWVGESIGNAVERGAVAYSQGTYLVRGAGGDVWANADTFQFVYRAVTGDVQILARVLSIENTDPWAKAGVMLRESPKDDSRHAFLAITPENGSTFQFRSETGGATDVDSGGAATAPYWLRLVRQGNAISGYRSLDGTTWEWIGTERIELPNRIYVGLAASSHNPSQTCAVRMSDVEVQTVGAGNPAASGRGDGLMAAYFDLTSSNVVQRVDPGVNFNWGVGAPASGISTDAFSVRWEGLVEAQYSEVYAFHLVNDDGARLWINGEKIIDAWSDRAATRTSGRIILMAGHRYAIKMEFYERAGQAVASLQWSSPSTTRQTIPRAQLYSPQSDTYSRIEDKDSDGMPDRWELANGLDPSVSSDAASDLDGDGLTNLQEYQAGTNPRRADTDGDGMPDGWEVANRMNPLDAADAHGDADHDGLTNLQEYQLGTNALSKDTDGDGLLDAMEVEETQTNPTSDDIDSIATIAEVTGASAVARLGRWSTSGTSIYAEDRRGYVEYGLSVPSSGMYRIEVEGASQNEGDPNKEFELIVSIDGERLGRSILVAPGVIHQFTPWLLAGEHRLRLYWDNAASRRSLKVGAVRVQALQGADANSNGISDWIENRLRRLCTVDATSVSSAVSPACVEGRGGFLSMMRLSRGTAQHGAGDRWFANVNLSPDAPTALVVSFQNHGLRITNQIVWRPTNLLIAEDMIVRQGDALLLDVVPAEANGGRASVAIEGGASYESSDGQPVVHRFTESGSFQVMGTYVSQQGARQSRTITVKVISASFGEEPAAWTGKARPWRVTQLPPEVVVDADPRLKLEELPRPEAGAREFNIGTDVREEQYVVARLGVGGPVVGNVAVQGFRLYSAAETYVRVLETYDDGSQLVEMGLVLSPVPTGITIRLDMQVGGVVFDDGTISKELRPPDFNALGESRIKFVRPSTAKTSVCHTTRVFQGRVLLGVHN